MSKTLPIRLRTVAATIVVVASGLIIFNVYQSIISSGDETMQALPIIQAEKTPFRILPDEPGGAKIPGQGSTLFNVIDEDRSDPLALAGADLTPEQAPDEEEQSPEEAPSEGFALPEVPEARTESLYGMIEDLKERDTQAEVSVQAEEGVVVVEEPMNNDGRVEVQEKLAEVIEKLDTEPEPIAEPTNEVVSEAVQVQTEQGESIVPTPSGKPNAPVKAAVKPVEAEKPKVDDKPFSVADVIKSDASKNYYIQLASLKDESAARAAYNKIRDDFPNLVSGLNVVFPKVDLGARGTFTRIQVGPLPQAQAQKRCADYSAATRGGTCLVISR